MSLAVGVFAVAGCALLATLLTDLLWATMLGVRAHLLPRLHVFAVDLKQRYGTWAEVMQHASLAAPIAPPTATPTRPGSPRPSTSTSEVVTGSTDGIGRAYAMELAKRGLNVVLVSRTHDKLAKVAAQIETMYGVKTKIIAADFSKGQFVYEEIEKELKDIPVGILVNNVGKQYSYPMYLTEVPEQELWDIVNINVGAATSMTRMLLPQMKLRKRGAVVNVSSSSELQPLPLMTVYAASKVYLKSFSEALRIEYQADGITIQHLSPLFINTKMNAFSYRLQTSSIFVPDAETYAQNAVNTLGIVNHSTGYWAHGIQYFFTTIPPKWVRSYIGNHMNKIFRRDFMTASSSKLPVL